MKNCGQGANYVHWNTHLRVTINAPETTNNFCFGHIGARGLGTFVYKAIDCRKQNPGQPWPIWAKIPQGTWYSHGLHVSPNSLYLAQLEDRLGADAVRAIAIPEQISGDGIPSVLANAKRLGASYTDLAMKSNADTRSWIRMNNKGESFEDAEIRSDGGELLKTDIPNHFE